MTIEEIVRKATGERGKVVTGHAAVEMLREILASEDCGNKDCPIHGPEDDGRIKDGDLDNLDSAKAWDLAIGTTGAAHNALLAGNATKTALLQKQADLWTRIGDKLATAEMHQQWEQEAARDGRLDARENDTNATD